MPSIGSHHDYDFSYRASAEAFTTTMSFPNEARFSDDISMGAMLQLQHFRPFSMLMYAALFFSIMSNEL